MFNKYNSAATAELKERCKEAMLVTPVEPRDCETDTASEESENEDLPLPSLSCTIP